MDWIVAVALALNALVALGGIVVTMRTRDDVVKVKKNTDGLTDALVKSSRQEGYETARLEGEERATILAEGQRQGRETEKRSHRKNKKPPARP